MTDELKTRAPIFGGAPTCLHGGEKHGGEKHGGEKYAALERSFQKGTFKNNK
jgi:hypothetical protein